MRYNGVRSRSYKTALRRIAAFAVIAVLAAVLSACGGISDIPDPSSDFYVCDFAEVISEESGEYICTLASALDGVSGAQIVIVTLPTLDGYAIDRYASALFSGWGVGDSERNNGIMLVMCPSEGEYWMTMGDGLDAALGDGVLKTMMAEKLEPCFAAGDCDGGARGIFDAIYEKLCKHYNVSPVPDSYDGGTYNGKAAYDAAVSGGSATGRVFMILILIVVIAAAFILMLRILFGGVLNVGGRKKRRGTARGAERRANPMTERRTERRTERGKDFGAAESGAAHRTAASSRAAASYGASDRAGRTAARGGQRSDAAQNARRGSAAYDALRRNARGGTSRRDDR